MSAAVDEQRVNMHVAARWWAGRGVPVFPLHHPVRVGDAWACSCRRKDCHSPAKHPLTANGLEDATTDLEQVDRWWRQHPEANIGLRTGVAFDLLDIDGAAGFDSLAKLRDDLGGEPQAIAVCESGRVDGGRHYYMTPAGKKARAGGKTSPTGLDVKGSGGYAVGAPSQHISGSRYRFVNGMQYGTITGAVPWDTVYDYLVANAPKKERERPPADGFTQPGTVSAGGDNAFGRAVLDRILDEMRDARGGHRWDTFAKDCIFDLARAIAGGALERGAAEAELADAARGVGMAEGEVNRLDELLDAALAKSITDPIAPKPRNPADTSRPYTAEENAQTPWEVPQSLTLPLPRFPTHVLGWLEQDVVDLSEDLQTPVDIVAMLTLAMLAAAVRGRAEVTVRGTWTEPLNLYVLVLAGAGETKSPALKVVAEPLRDLERRLQEQSKEEIARRRQARRVQEGRLKKAEAVAISASGDDRILAEHTADEERAKLDELPEAVLPRLLIGDTTAEGLVRLLAEQGGAMASLTAEGGLFDTLVGGRYSGGAANLDAVLQAHDGREPILVDRKGSDPIRVERPALTLGLAVQPNVLQTAGASDVAVGRGFLARFLFSYPASRIGARDTAREPRDEPYEGFQHLVEGVEGLLGGVSSISSTSAYRSDLRLSTTTLSYFQGFRAALEPRMSARGDLAGLGAWAAKLPGQVVRLAGLLQLLTLAPAYRKYTKLGPLSVEPDAMAAAIEVADYLIAHATAAHRLIAGQHLVHNHPAHQLLGWIREQQMTELVVSDAHQRLRGRSDFAAAEAVHAAAEVLVAFGYLRPLAPEKKPGRPSVRYAVNPLEPR